LSQHSHAEVKHNPSPNMIKQESGVVARKPRE